MFNLHNFGPFFEGEGTGGGAGSSGQSGDEGGSGPQTLPEWIGTIEDETQRETVNGLLAAHVGKLEKALSSERETRKDLEKQVRDLASKAEKGSDSQKQLEELANNLEEAGRKSNFYEEAHKAGVSNLKLAFVVATQDDLFDKRGNVDFEQMKESYPELFGAKKVPDGNAGSGNGKTPDGKSMNAFIRKAAGRNF